MSQYFENDDSIKSSPRSIEYDIFNNHFSLKTDLGVFSKNGIDEGTYAFLKVLIPLQLKGRILDVGCGYGALGLTLASFIPSSDFVLVDVNDRALNLASENIKRLNLRNVTCLRSDIYQNVEGQFDSIVINPPIRAGKKVIYQMFSGAYDYLVDGGSLFIVIRKSHGAFSARDYIESVFGNCTLLKRDKGYYIYQARK
ncbi:MAG: methyltransferase [Erysipelotrichaceae bacterium]|nr:methyltransferase [Erysipelotrichaceae bacterium]